MTGIFIEKGGDTSGKHMPKEKVVLGNGEKRAVCKPRGEAAGETGPAATSILGFQPAEP